MSRVAEMPRARKWELIAIGGLYIVLEPQNPLYDGPMQIGVYEDLSTANLVRGAPEMLLALTLARDGLRLAFETVAPAVRDNIVGPALDAVEQAIRLAEHGEAL